jgi:hypothetical protein
VAFLQPRCRVHACPSNAVCALYGLLWPLGRANPCVRLRCTLHRLRSHRSVGLAFFIHDTFAQLTGHFLPISRQKIKLRCNLLVGKVQSHQVQTQHPDTQRLVMSLEDRATQIIELLPTFLTFKPLSMNLMCMTLFLRKEKAFLFDNANRAGFYS